MLIPDMASDTLNAKELLKDDILSSQAFQYSFNSVADGEHAEQEGASASSKTSELQKPLPSLQAAVYAIEEHFSMNPKSAMLYLSTAMASGRSDPCKQMSRVRWTAILPWS